MFHRGESGEIPVQSGDLTLMLSGERGKNGIRHQVTDGTGLGTELAEQDEVAVAWRDRQMVRLTVDRINEGESIDKRGRYLENTAIRGES